MLLVGVPLAVLVGTAFENGAASLAPVLTGDDIARPMVNTIWTSLAITVLAVAAGAGAAFVTERSPVPGRAWLRGALVASLLTAPIVSAVGWARAYGRAGLLDQLLGVHWEGLYGPGGIVVVSAAGAAPLAYLVVAAGLASRAEPDLERAARASGATAPQAARTVTLPLARPALGAAAALVFVTSVNGFEIPAVLGIPAGFPTMTTRLYQNLTQSADPAAFTSSVVLAVVLVVLALVVMAPSDALTGARRLRRTGGAVGSGGPLSPRSWGLASLLWGFLVLTAAVPLLAVVLVALTRGVGLAPVPANWTTANFSAALSGPTASALMNTLGLAAMAATGVLAFGALTAALGTMPRGRPLGTLVTLTFAVAGSALAVAVLLAYGRFLRDTLAIILVAYLAKFWALGHRPLAAAADRLPGDLIRAGRASGARSSVAVRTIIAPLMWPALAGSWLLVFLFAVHELTISSLLYGPGNETLAVVILNSQELGDIAVTSALSVLLSLLIAVAALLLVWVRSRARRLGHD
ncbi:MAG: ABC transporter permease subunit [Chloroflexota bacterium]|nr:ABC transporter permease subunit [Chloroflexota bacterium]